VPIAAECCYACLYSVLYELCGVLAQLCMCCASMNDTARRPNTYLPAAAGADAPLDTDVPGPRLQQRQKSMRYLASESAASSSSGKIS
jgi:hypothetical protein